MQAEDTYCLNSNTVNSLIGNVWSTVWGRAEQSKTSAVETHRKSWASSGLTETVTIRSWVPWSSTPKTKEEFQRLRVLSITPSSPAASPGRLQRQAAPWRISSPSSWRWDQTHANSLPGLQPIYPLPWPPTEHIPSGIGQRTVNI